MLEEMEKQKKLGVSDKIADFVKWRAVEPDFPWSRRRNNQ